MGEIPRQRGRNGKQNVKGGAQEYVGRDGEVSAIPARPRGLQAVRSRSPCPYLPRRELPKTVVLIVAVGPVSDYYSERDLARYQFA